MPATLAPFPDGASCLRMLHFGPFSLSEQAQNSPMTAQPACWLVKSEPDCFSIHDLAASPAQDHLLERRAKLPGPELHAGHAQGDRVLFYHSSTDPPAVAGTAVVVRQAYPDHTGLDPQDDHYDPKASPANPIWEMVDIRLDEIFSEPVPIGVLRGVKALAGMELLRKGSRLSVQPVRPREFETVLQLARQARVAARRRSKKPPQAAGRQEEINPRDPQSEEGAPPRQLGSPQRRFTRARLRIRSTMNARDPLAWIDEELDQLDRQGLLRALSTHAGAQRVRLHDGSRELINFGSNDYLALAADPSLLGRGDRSHAGRRDRRRLQPAGHRAFDGARAARNGTGGLRGNRASAGVQLRLCREPGRDHGAGAARATRSMPTERTMPA